MGFLGKLFSKENDEPQSKQREDMLKNPMVTAGIWQIEEGCDVLPLAEGAFGITKTNPIPVNGLIGESCYLSRLRSGSGVGFFYHRIGSIAFDDSRHPVDQFELVASDASEWLILFFSPYFARRSTKVPDGLTLFPWNDMSEIQRILSKCDSFGTKSTLRNFPDGLVDAVAMNKGLAGIAPGLPAEFSKQIQEILKKASNWSRPYRLPNPDETSTT